MFRKSVLIVGLALVVIASTVAFLMRPYPLPDASDAEDVRQRVINSLGDSVESVSVEPVRMTGISDDSGKAIVGYHVAFVLAGSQAKASNYAQTDWGVSLMLPPDSGRLSRERFVALVEAFAAETSRPMGTVVPLSEYSDGAPFTTIGGVEYPLEQFWIVTPGFTSVEELKAARSADAGVVFQVPPAGPIVAVGSAPGGVLRADVGD